MDLFRDYIAEVQRQLAASRRHGFETVGGADANSDGAASSDERYTPIPARVISPSAAVAQISNPAEHLASHLLDPEIGGSVYIESPGSRGKSALLHQVVRLATARFAEKGNTPIPLLAEDEVGVEQMAQSALGRHLISSAVLQEQLERSELPALYCIRPGVRRRLRWRRFSRVRRIIGVSIGLGNVVLDHGLSFDISGDGRVTSMR